MSIVRDLIKRFPLSTIRTSFGYGSSVFPQKGNTGSDRQIDMILICDSPKDFHSENLLLNPSDYSYFMRSRGVENLVKWNGKATGLYFNPFVKTDIGELKYGLISTENAKRDLERWEHLYLAGRLHKPVKFVTPTKTWQTEVESNEFDLSRSLPADDVIGGAIRQNLVSAVRLTSMLNLRTQPKTTLDEIMLTICSLSYLGDIRTQGFEDTQKVNKIFEGSYEHLKKLYEPVMKDCSWLEYSSDGTIYQNLAGESLRDELLKLPLQLTLGLASTTLCMIIGC